MKFNFNKLFTGLLFMFMSLHASAGLFGPDNFEECVLEKGIQFAKVSTPTEAITFAPIACKREILEIKQFFLNSAFKPDVITALIDSIKEGVEIDLVNVVYKERLKYLKN